MNVLINIDEKVYKIIKDIRNNDKSAIGTHAYMLEVIANGIPIPDNATNDDVLKALFDERGYVGIHDRMMHTKWLFAPYQKGGKE